MPYQQSSFIFVVAVFASFACRRRRCLLVLTLVLITLLMLCIQNLMKPITFQLLAASGTPNWRKAIFFQSDVSEHDAGEELPWYKGSQCSGLSGVFVGDQPLFPPCQSDIPSGVATWGNYPFVGPFQYVNNSKSPCWWKGGSLTCIPYFYLIGVSKSGTSDLYFRISIHPDVIHAPKEPHWFDRGRFRPLKQQEFGDYTYHYRELSAAITNDIRKDGQSVKISGDASPSYFYDNNNWAVYSGNEGCNEPRVILANHIRHLNPDVKIILIIRHPVDRLFSRYLFDHQSMKAQEKDPPSPAKFHEYVADGLRKYSDCFERWSLRHCVYNKSLAQSVHQLRIQESLYPVLLEDWLRVIPREQMLIIRFEDYKNNITKELMRICQFLELGVSNMTLQEMVETQIRNKGVLRKKMKSMLPQTRTLLHNFFQPFIVRLAKQLGDDRFLWKEYQANT